MTLATYAKKYGIKETKLRQDAYSLLLPYDEMSTEKVNRFIKDDVEATRSMFKEDYMTFPKDDIARLTGMTMPINKKNWRKRTEHIKMMNLIRNKVNSNREWWNKDGRPKGSGTAQVMVYE